MKKIFTLLVLAFIVCSFKAVAQTNTACNANFTFVITGNTVQFTPVANPDSTLIQHSWVFGDGTVVQGVYAPLHTYADTGTYIVTQYVTKTSGNGIVTCSDTVREAVTINVSCNIQPSFTWKVDSANGSVSFTNTTFLPSTLAVPSNWFFGDDSSATTWNATHVYAKPGKYYVCLRLQLGLNCIKYGCDSITIPSPAICNIQAYFNSTTDSSQNYGINFHDYTTDLLTTDSSYWSFGDSTTSRDLNPTHIYKQAGTYDVCLTITRITTPGTAPCTSKFCRTIVIQPLCNLKVAYTWKLDSLKQNTVDFTNTTPIPITGSLATWSFGDGSAPDSSWNAIHTYTQPGKYYVCLRILTNNTCINYLCDSITVPAPVCNFQPAYTWQLDTRTANTVDFTNTTAINVTDATALWFFGDDSSASTWSTTHTFAKPGKYYVCLRVQLNPTCYKYQCDSITIPSPVVCNIQAYFNSTTDSSQNYGIDFHDYTTNLLTTDSSYWSFGDSTTSRDLNPTHIYKQAGTYDVCLTITRITTPGTIPCTSKFCRTIVIQPACNLTANFTYKKDSLALDINTYQFTNTSTPANSFDSSYWNFGDGTSSYDTNPTHVFATSGTYTVCLYIKNAINSATTAACESHICETVTVPTVCNIKTAYAWQLDTLKQNTIDFTNTTNSATSIASAEWSFGDNSPLDSTWNATHTYAQPGKYYVCLRVQTTANCVSYQCDSIIITPPVPDCEYFSLFTFAQSATNSGAYTFIPVYQNTVVKYTWTFGDTTGSENIIAQHYYTKPGNYTACLTAYRDSNCASTTCKEITVIQQADCDSINLSYSYYPDGNTPNEIHFYTNTNYPIQQQYWVITSLTNPADSPVVITQTNPVYVFDDTGYYNVCVRALTVGNCVKEYCNTIHITTVATPCQLQAYPNPANTDVGVNVQLASPELIHAYLYNIQSVLLQQTYQQGNTGTNLITMDTQKLAAGFYTIELIYGNKTCFAKFQKL